ncbi:hypothetical protein PWT90_01583 [Aphanocladium album]|nr:hypothetical protein PWT90_01583 [Aphanocladium album]
MTWLKKPQLGLTMTAKFPINRPLLTLRSPAFRSLILTFSVLFLLITVAHQGKFSVPRQFRKYSAFRPPTATVHQQRPLQEHPQTSITLDPDSNDTLHFNMNCGASIDHLFELKYRYSLDDRFQYMKRYVRFTRTEGLERKSMTKLGQNLLPYEFQFKAVDVRQNKAIEDECMAPLEVAVPKSGLPRTVNASDFIFGVSTTYNRFIAAETSPINEWTFWLTNGNGRSNGGKLVLMLLDATDEQLQEVANTLGDVNIDADVYHSDSRLEMAVRYLTLVPTLYTHPDARHKKWLVTCDDDTFFPSMHGLIAKMNSMDYTREMYVGTLSEDVGAIERHGSQAFGGGGVFLSLPLARRITELYGSCTTSQKIQEADSGWGAQGDIILRKCIYEHTETRLTTVWDLWQLDILGHPSGFYESGVKPLSLHHYRGGGWHRADPAQMARVAHTCGEDCTMLRFQTPDDFILSGYSIAHYPHGVTFDVHQVEATLHAAQDNKGWNFDYKLGAQRPSLLGTGRKIAWDLQEAHVDPDGSIRQTYTRKHNDERWTESDGRPMSNIDGVIELVWIPS